MEEDEGSFGCRVRFLNVYDGAVGFFFGAGGDGDFGFVGVEGSGNLFADAGVGACNDVDVSVEVGDVFGCEIGFGGVEARPEG